MDNRTSKISLNKVGGNASKEALNYRINIPNTWAKELGITKENRDVNISFDGNKIIIEKAEEKL